MYCTKTRQIKQTDRQEESIYYTENAIRQQQKPWHPVLFVVWSRDRGQLTNVRVLPYKNNYGSSFSHYIIRNSVVINYTLSLDITLLICVSQQ